MHAHIPDDKLASLSEALFAGRKIEAIRTYRELTGLGLKEAKDDVEELERDLRREHPGKFVARSSGRGCFTGAAVFLLCLGGIATWYMSR